MEKQPFLFAVSGVKNSGKTTLITKLIPILTEYGLRVATIKHDGHEFCADVPGTDTYAHLQAGAYGTAVFSDGKYMVVKQAQVTEQELARMFPEADLILLEGFKDSDWPKVELVRKGNSERCVCRRETVAVLSDFVPEGCDPAAVMDLNDVKQAADLILDEWFARTKLSMVVLAGGKSSRMGNNKADLMYRDKTFLEWQIEKGKQLGISDLIVSGYQGSGCQERIAADRYKERGPLGGLESAFRQAVHDNCMVITVDMPLLPAAELKCLIRAFRKASGSAMVMKHGERTEPLIGIYKTCAAEAAEQELLSGKGSVFGLLNRTGYTIYESGGPEDWFWNVNSPVQYRGLE